MRLRSSWSLIFGLPASALGYYFPGVEQRYVHEKLIGTGSLGLPTTGLVAALGDFDSDQLLDLFYLSADQRSLSTYVWDRPNYIWQELVQSRIRTSSDFIILNVLPGDYNYDGKLDILLMGGKNPGGWWGGDESLEMQVYLQGPNGTFCTFPRGRRTAPMTPADEQRAAAAAPYPLNASAVAQPIPFDATGDMRTDLIGFAAGALTVPQLWNNVWETTNGTQVFNL